MKLASAAFIGALGVGIACSAASEPQTRFAPPADRTLLIVGQELGSVADYVQHCTQCPAPAGVTTYLGFYDLLSAADGFGGLGEDAAGHSAPDADWGAGATSAARMLAQFPDAALVLGLDISNGRRKDGLAQIGHGLHDDKIERLATFLRAAQRPVFLRIGYEFDGMWNQGYEVRATYIAAYRRIVDGLRARQANNVAFVWQASASPIDDVLEHGKREKLRDWYPGAAYVDWVGLSWFLRPKAQPGATRTRVPDQLELAQEVLEFARAAGKRVMIAESTPQGYDLSTLTRSNISPIWDGAPHADTVKRSADEIWAEWYEPLLSFIDANRALIGAFAYINARWDDQPMWAAPYASGYWGDSRIQANPRIQELWLTEVRRAPWLHGGPALFTTLTASQGQR
ncbi:MAG TPA: glycosyl hydrolase [Povalibacter sp.]|uniref:glycosyl hydrolase n=1 Tax=Povalibacter sp. TaxID=1962978 RepID=UPI002CAF59A9|nr:glycosyl hydrolase [Povalibacter sp.]HMN47224.1 glycosyl hydrolase [Povalibacter sp.]